MPAHILDGNKIAEQIKMEVAEEVRNLERSGIRPGLAAVLVGHDPASEIYVRNKVKTSEQLGLFSEKITPPETVSTEQMLTIVNELNARADIGAVKRR